ncbi:unnamed protein product [Bursaphelenchus xylophilus]|uniref:(pine wood nematode) hypothetical protein n=1 Tax=Bursaphelenchus xylophilus TaxID=6326 RepID=A0A1I7RWH3_BURXY|nr:unnamed protein product [Bursaphelenchus xylophilus]CAG9128376.1 unnamed protein product [Bursaphelenchus xylophilus]
MEIEEDEVAFNYVIKVILPQGIKAENFVGNAKSHFENEFFNTSLISTQLQKHWFSLDFGHTMLYVIESDE